MAEENKNALREIPKHDGEKIKASVEDRSLVKDLVKSSMDEIIIPKSKDVMRDLFTGVVNMFADALRSGIDRMIYPDGNVPNRKPTNGGVYTGVTNYTSYSRPIGEYKSSMQKGRDPLGQRPGNEVKYIWVESEAKAKEVINMLKEDIDNCGKAKVASLYEKVGIHTTMADFKYGWTDANALGYYEDLNRRGEEYRWFLDLPRPVDIIHMQQ